MRSSNPLLLTVVMVAALGVAAAPASAQVHQDPGVSCGEEGGGSQCYRCTATLIGLDANDNGVYEYECTQVDPSPLFNSSRTCTPHSSGCSQSDWCVIT